MPDSAAQYRANPHKNSTADVTLEAGKSPPQTLLYVELVAYSDVLRVLYRNADLPAQLGYSLEKSSKSAVSGGREVCSIPDQFHASESIHR